MSNSFLNNRAGLFRDKVRAAKNPRSSSRCRGYAMMLKERAVFKERVRATRVSHNFSGRKCVVLPEISPCVNPLLNRAGFLEKRVRDNHAS